MSSLFETPETLDEFRGLTPRSWICVGAAFSREDVKALLLSRDVAFTGDAVQTFQGLCQKIAGVEASSVLASPCRQEVLRILLSVPALKNQMPELKRLKRQGAFLRRLDYAFQAGRMAFAHWEEAEVFGERLALKLGPNPLRFEIQKLALAYEDWLENSKLWDPPLVIRRAIERLSQGAKLTLPEKIYHLSGQTQESLEKSFWEELGRLTEVVTVGPTQFTQGSNSGLKLSWERWHTLDDAAERLAGTLSSRVREGEGLSDCVSLISDSSSSRRTLRRAFAQQGIQLSDPRDPTRIRWDETIKWAMLPLEVVARGFERTRVIPYLQNYSRATEAQKSEWIREIQNRGIRNGLESYAGGKLVLCHAELKNLNLKLGGKKTALELARAHLEYLEESLDPERVWVRSFFEGIWKQLTIDLERVFFDKRRAAPLLWLERIQARIAEAPAPVERLKPQGGLDAYRLHQIPTRAYRKISIFGVPALWLSDEGVGDYWFSEREREVLSSEFAVRSGIQVRQERTEALRAWLSGAEEVVFLDALYDQDGRERESILPILELIQKNFGSELQIPEKPDEHGSHPRWTKSYGALRPVPPQKAVLTGLGPRAKPTDQATPLISATALENYSRCGFLALARTRWRLEDMQEPETDLWPQVKGILLHEAVKLLVESRDADGNFAKTAEEVIDTAWENQRPKGLLRGARIEAYVKRKLAVLLRVFQEQERKYVQRAQTRVLALEDVELKVDYEGFSVRGNPDRIDEHPDGLWIIDYKTSSSAPNGAAMIENGYRLQLPFYALAAQKHFSKSALGFQFVQLDKKGTRTNGAYFKPHNGKEPGKLTATTAASKSLLTIPREEAWGMFEEEIQDLGARFVSGKFEARPRINPRSKECDTCQVADFCGYRRILEESEDD